MHFTKSLIAALAGAGSSAVAIPTSHCDNISTVAEQIRKFIANGPVQNITAVAENTVDAIAQSIADCEAQINAASKELEALAKSQVANATAAASKIMDNFNGNQAIQARTVATAAVTDPDDWHYFHYEGLRTGNDHWWRGGGSRIQDMKAAHEQVVTPTLPQQPKVPKPFLPITNEKLLALYSLALAEFHAEEAKGMSEKMDNLAQKKKDMAKFSRMNQCVYDKPFCPRLKFRDTPATSAYYRKYKKTYSQLKGKMMQEMQVKGLYDLGENLEAFMKETGLTM